MLQKAVIKSPIITEKAMDLSTSGKYCFKVTSNATKPEISKQIEKMYKVKVVTVNVLNVSGKERRRGRIKGRTANYKKAVVTLAPGQKIEIFKGA